MIQTVRTKKAGGRNRAPVMYRPYLPGSLEDGGAAATGGSTAIPPSATRLLALLVGRRGGLLELALDAADVLRVPQELLEDAPLALARRRTERRRLQVGHVEHHCLRAPDRLLVRAVDCVRKGARVQVPVAGREPAVLRPRRRRCRGGEELHERPDRRRVSEGDEQVARNLDRAGVGACGDRRERRNVEAAAGLRLRRAEDDARDEVTLEHHRGLRRA